MFATPLALLRDQLRLIQAAGSAERPGFAVGVPDVDERLAGRALAADGLHEIAGADLHLGSVAAATLFSAGLARRRAGAAGKVLWVSNRRDLFAPGLAQVGLGPDQLLHAECRKEEDLLPVVEEGLRHGGLAAVVGEVGRVSLTATRRLQLAAEESGTAALLLRHWRKREEDPLAPPSAAMTRWRIGCVPSRQLAVDGIARPRWQVELVRQRGGAPHCWILEGWDGENRLALPAGPADRQVAAGRADPQRRAA